jgi:hypothetical protein
MLFLIMKSNKLYCITHIILSILYIYERYKQVLNKVFLKSACHIRESLLIVIWKSITITLAWQCMYFYYTVQNILLLNGHKIVIILPILSAFILHLITVLSY